MLGLEYSLRDLFSIRTGFLMKVKKRLKEIFNYGQFNINFIELIYHIYFLHQE